MKENSLKMQFFPLWYHVTLRTDTNTGYKQEESESFIFFPYSRKKQKNRSCCCCYCCTHTRQEQSQLINYYFKNVLLCESYTVSESLSFHPHTHTHTYPYICQCLALLSCVRSVKIYSRVRSASSTYVLLLFNKTKKDNKDLNL